MQKLIEDMQTKDDCFALKKGHIYMYLLLITKLFCVVNK